MFSTIIMISSWKFIVRKKCSLNEELESEQNVRVGIQPFWISIKIIIWCSKETDKLYNFYTIVFNTCLIAVFFL